MILQAYTLFAQDKTMIENVDSVLHKMTIEEKIGQLNQLSGKWEVTGPITDTGSFFNDIKKGKVGSLLNIRGAKRTREMQELAMSSRLKIPLLFGQDVIHGYKTIFPIPLAEAASWDIEAIEKSARIAAIETAASGIHWTFAPMVDISRDPRWGRVMEGAGEDPFLGSMIAKARINGFQGKSLGSNDAILACVKHFAAYGAAIGGRDYNSTDLSDNSLWNIYLPPFKAAIDAGAATLMNGFNDLNGVPATANPYLLQTILKDKWKFSGFVVSDWGSVRELVAHGYVANKSDAAIAAIKSGCDMDMEGRCFINYLDQAIKDGRVPISTIDNAVKRILLKKFELGLFDDPFKFCDESREQKEINNKDHRMIARKMAERSIVLLKNDRNILPLSTKLKTIAVIGALAKSQKDMLGSWSVKWPDISDVVTQFDGIKNKFKDANILYAKGCEVEDTLRTGFKEALEVAAKAEIIIVSVGEIKEMSGEAKSRSNIHLPGVQEELVKALCRLKKPVIVIVNAGRPLIFNWIADNVPVILYSWWLGSEAGNAIADVLVGDYNPSAKIPMTFPASEGQIPLYYNYLHTGKSQTDKIYRSGYIDFSNNPKYAFGFGLSYTTFQYSDLQIPLKKIKSGQAIEVSFTLTNTGHYVGEEIAQLYIRDKVASVLRPVKELKGFKKVLLRPGEKKTVTFEIDQSTLSFYNQQLDLRTEPGEFELMIGAASNDIKLNGICEFSL